MTKILITGNYGYLGTAICKKIVQDQRFSSNYVLGIDNLYFEQNPVKYNNIFFKYADIINTEDIRKNVQHADIIIHCAALVGAPLCEKLGEFATEVNYNAVERMVKLLSPNQRILFFNSNSAYGTGGKEHLTEDSPMNPLSRYARDKLEAEKIILDHSNSVSFRLATLMGKSDRQRLDLLVNNLAYRCYFDKKIDLFEPYVRRNYCNVDDVAQIVLNFCHNKYTGIFNLGNDSENCTKEELVNKIIKVIPATVNFVDGEDSDKRDYLVSSKKLADLGYKATTTVEESVSTLKIFFDQLPFDLYKRNKIVKKMFNY